MPATLGDPIVHSASTNSVAVLSLWGWGKNSYV